MTKLGSLWLMFNEAAPPPALLTDLLGESAISHASRHAMLLGIRTQAFGYAKAHGWSLSRVSIWEYEADLKLPARATPIMVINSRAIGAYAALPRPLAFGCAFALLSPTRPRPIDFARAERWAA